MASFLRRWPLKTVINKLRPRACILAYHRVASLAFDPFGQCVTPENFAAHLRVLRQHYELVSLDSLLERLRAGSYRKRMVAVTFDDGYVDNYRVAYPIAAALDVPLIIFVTVQPVLEHKHFWWDRLGASILRNQEASLSLTIDGTHHQFAVTNQQERLAVCRTIQALLRGMGDKQRDLILQTIGAHDEAERSVEDSESRPLTVSELQAFSKLDGVQIGAHTMTHPVLSRLARDEQWYELKQSRACLSELLGDDIVFMSYPFGKAGDMTPATVELVRDARYGAAFTTQPVPALSTTSLHRLPRLTVHDWPEAEFKHRLDILFG